MHLVRLAIGHAIRRRAVSLVAISITGAMAAAIVTLTGNAARQADLVLEALRDPGSRSIVLRSSTGPSIPASTTRSIASLPGVELAIAFPQVQAATAAATRDSAASAGFITVYTLAGQLPVHLIEGRQAEAGEVVVSASAARKLRLVSPLATGIETSLSRFPVVGVFDVDQTGPIGALLSDSIIGAPAAADNFSTAAFLAREPADVATIVSVANALIPSSSGVSVDYEQRAAELQKTIASANNRNVAQLAVSVTVVGALVQAASALLNALLQRRENARRRALGYSRPEIIVLGTIEAAILASIGAVLGAGGAAYRLDLMDTTVAPAQLVATVGFLVALGVVAAVPGGATAAFQDPARILRVP